MLIFLSFHLLFIYPFHAFTNSLLKLPFQFLSLHFKDQLAIHILREIFQVVVIIYSRVSFYYVPPTSLSCWAIQIWSLSSKNLQISESMSYPIDNQTVHPSYIFHPLSIHLLIPSICAYWELPMVRNRSLLKLHWCGRDVSAHWNHLLFLLAHS